MLNHSDQPNTVPTFQGQKISFRAIERIAAGTELTVSYIELAAPRHERRHALACNYFFDIDAPPVCSTKARCSAALAVSSVQT